MPAELIQISHSRVEAFLSCERKEYYGYHLGLKRKKEGIALGLGNAVHSCTEALYAKLLELGKSARQQRRHWDQGVAAMWARYHELVSKGWTDEDPKRWKLEEILQHYIDNEQLVLAGYRILAVEKEFHVRWSDESTILFRVDLIVADPGGRQLVVDTKTVWDFYSDFELRLLPQLPKYAGMLRFLGYPIQGGMYNMIRSRRLNGGKMLKPEIVAALQEKLKVPEGEHYQGKPLEKHTVEVLTQFAAEQDVQVVTPPEPAQLYRLEPVPFTDERVQRVLQEQFDVAARILERVPLKTEQYDRIAVRSVSKMNCKGCPFKELCPAELAGADTGVVMEDFTHRDPRELPELDGEDDEDA